jgi:hypothetical protein
MIASHIENCKISYQRLYNKNRPGLPVQRFLLLLIDHGTATL